MSTPARTASSYKSGQTGRRTAFFARNGVRVALAAACSALLVAGCSQGVGGGLSSNLPPAGGGGLLSFTSVAMPDGIAGRAYSKVAVTSVETQSKTNFPISPTVASGTAPLASCTVSAGALPPGMNAALTVDSTGAGCVISGTPSAAAAGNTYQFTIQALDSNSPPRAAAQTFTMNVRPEFTVTAPAAIVANALPAGVQGRTYGQIPGNAAAMTATTNLSAANGNGAVGAKNYCSLSVTPALASLTLTQVAGTNNCQLQGSGALAAAGSYKVTVAITDNPIVDPETNLAAVPANTIAAAANATLNVAAPLKIVAADAVSATPPTAVQGRAYGSGSGCSGGACSPLTYASTGGLPSVEPADSYLFSSSAALTAAGINCAATASSTVAKTTCSGTASSATGATNFSVSVDDAGNFATPSGSASGTTASTGSLSLTVDSALNLAVSPDPAANPAVQNRPYGTGTGCTGAGGACVAPTYTPSGGLGTYSFPAITGAPPVGITCAPNGGNTAVVCSGTPTATGPATFGVAASDVGNASTPADTTAVVSKTLTVNGALTLSPPASLPPAVNGRAFGAGSGCSGGNCVPAVFTISGGLGTYAATASIVSAPGTWACALAGSNYNCSSTAVVSGAPNLSITASDGASPTTPGATTASATVAVTVSPSMAVTPLGGAAPDAVTGRSYGSAPSDCSGGACLPLQYSVTGGLGNYQAGTLAVADSASDSLACAVASLTYSCSSGAINGNATASAAMTMTAVEAGNASTPGGTAIDASRTLAIQSALAISQNLGTTWPDAVNGRTYGTGNNCGAGGAATCEAAQFSATGGIGAYAFSKLNFPLPFTCSGSPTYSCSSAGITSASGIFHPQVTVQDAGNASTPFTSASTSATTTLNVNGAMTVAPFGTFPDAVTGRAYGSTGVCSPNPTCQPIQYKATGGLANYGSVALTGAGGDSFTCTGTATYSCSITQINTVSSEQLTMSVTDSGNASVPGSGAPVIDSSRTLTVFPPMTLTLQGSVNEAVKGRAYGTGLGCTGGACVGVAYGAAGGLGTYNGGSGILIDGADSFSCSFASPNFTCSAATISSTPGPHGLTISASENGNASTPSFAATNSAAVLTIDSPLVVTASQGPTWQPAVKGRSYGLNGTPNTFTATGGIQPYNFGPQAFPAGLACAPPLTAVTTITCSGTITDSAQIYTPTVAVVDTGNASTPASTPVSDPNSVSTNSLTVNPLLTISAITLPNALKDYPYPTNSGAATLTASGGLSTLGITWDAPASVSGAVCASTGSFPGGLGSIAINASTGAITGTPTTASASAGQYAFVACVSDTPNSMTPPGAADSTSLNLAIDVMAPLAYVSEADNIDVINTQTQSVLTSISSTGNGPYGVAFSPSGRYAYVTLSGVNQLAVYDAITNAQVGSLIDLSAGCGPKGVAATASDIFIACNSSNEVDIVDARTLTLNAGTLSTGAGSGPFGVAVSPDETRVYVTLATANKLFVVDSGTLSAVTSVALSNAVGVNPVGITVVQSCGCGTGPFAYIAERNSGAPDGLLIEKLAGDSFATQDTIQISNDGSAIPSFVAATPDNARVYLTLDGLDQFAVIDNTQATPALISGSTFPLSGTATQSEGATIPPASPYRAFIAEGGSGKIAVIDDSPTAPADTGTPITPGSSGPVGIASVPAPK